MSAALDAAAGSLIGWTPLRLSGHSMAPLYEHGALLVLERCEVERLPLGALVAVRERQATHSAPGEHWVVHRIVRRVQRQGTAVAYITQGDNVRRRDRLVKREQVVGRITGRVDGSVLRPMGRAEEIFGLCFAPVYRACCWRIGRGRRLVPAFGRRARDLLSSLTGRWNGVEPRIASAESHVSRMSRALGKGA